MGRSWTGMACSKYSNVYEFGGIIDWTGDIEGGEQEQSVDDNWQNTEALPETDETGNNNGVENGGDDMKEAAKLLYQGHASMRITTSEGKVIYVDPFAGEGYDKPADLILMTHGHYDHTQKDMITTKNPDCKTITWTEALKDGQLERLKEKYHIIWWWENAHGYRAGSRTAIM